ncbi:MAG TPA: PhoPQ-activated protein PqaA family protein [Candidatus Binatia bacterium]|nr:PhoPQ-activated protein PqaA family protein [Candidatus Binatia bacterium]
MLWCARSVLAAFVFSFLPSLAFADLEQYLRKPEPEFAWSLKDTNEQAGDRTYNLQFVSQNWQGITWRHQLQVYQPKVASPNRLMFLWVTGGSPRPAHALIGMELARKIGAPVAFLFNIPNQPLLEDKLSEDNLIAETFVRYLKTQDENWPLLFPMVKSVVKAMDVLQAFSAGDWKQPVERFIVSGASKRGWTTWLTAAADKRVGAIAPMVIDTLNMGAQMPKQIEAFGAFSERLQPYVKRGLLPIPQSPEGKRLLSMVDPWSYRERFSMPKFIVNGSNDFYWVTDALNLYWKDLPGDKWVLYVPNTGHDLLRPNAESMNRLLNGLAAFSRHQMSGKPMPALSWKNEQSGRMLRLTIDASAAPKAARLWAAEAANQDFRTATWRERPMEISGGHIVGEMTAPEKGYLAFFGELDYNDLEMTYQLSTQIRIIGAPAKAD